MSAILGRAITYGRMIKFQHSIFALPFALSSLVLAADGGVRPAQVFWILVAMVGARSAAMGFNRLADQWFDARNPRTAGRELPRGVLTRAFRSHAAALACAHGPGAAQREPAQRKQAYACARAT